MAEAPFLSKLSYNSLTEKYDIEGSFADLLHSLQSLMNFTYSLEPPPDNQWGGLQPNGTWSGMMRLVQEEIVDFGMQYYEWVQLQ